jgi:hypothetical protein
MSVGLEGGEDGGAGGEVRGADLLNAFFAELGGLLGMGVNGKGKGKECYGHGAEDYGEGSFGRHGG